MNSDLIEKYLTEIKQFELTTTILKLQTNKLIKSYHDIVIDQKRKYKNNQNNNLDKIVIMVIDTETTGFPIKRSFNEYYHYSCTDKYDNARLVSFSYALYNGNGEELTSDTLLVVPSYNFEISEEATKIHGITRKMCIEDGLLITKIADILSEKLENVNIIVGHNIQFDLNIIKSELCRIKRDDIIKRIINIRDICTMFYSSSVTKLPFPNPTKNYDSSHVSYKPPSLAELFKFLFGTDLQNAHCSKYDVSNCAKCFFELVKRNIIKI